MEFFLPSCLWTRELFGAAGERGSRWSGRNVIKSHIQHEVKIMPVKKHLTLFIAATTILILLTGCGGGNSASFPPPQGGFTNANFNGAFAFSYTGSDAQGFLTVAGSLQADGAGHITSGMEDVNSGFGIATNASVTGTYAIRADGRGSATLNSPAGNTTIDFVLIAGGHALVTRFDAAASGSGTIDQQTAAAFSNTALAGTFAYSLAGIDAVSNPAASAGSFTSDASGNITTGVDDLNDNGVIITNHPLTGSIPVTGSGRGTATLNTAVGTLTVAFYVVDANHIKFTGINAGAAFGGDAFRQTGAFSNASLTGPFAFTIAGADVLNGPFAAGGVLTSDGAGNVTSGVEDFNDSGILTSNLAVTGTYSVAASGRGTLTVTNSAGTFNFVIYPSTAGIITLEIDNRFVTGGMALQQQSTPFSNGSLQGNYGLNFTGASTIGELDSIAQFMADGASSLTGIVDLNNTGSITFGQALTGDFSVSANGRATMALQTPLGTQNYIVYLVNGSRALFVELDTTVVSVGEIQHQ